MCTSRYDSMGRRSTKAAPRSTAAAVASNGNVRTEGLVTMAHSYQTERHRRTVSTTRADTGVHGSTPLHPATSDPHRRAIRDHPGGRPHRASSPTALTARRLRAPYGPPPERGSCDVLQGARCPRAGRHPQQGVDPVSYTHLRAHETKANLVCRL